MIATGHCGFCHSTGLETWAPVKSAVGFYNHRYLKYLTVSLKLNSQSLTHTRTLTHASIPTLLWIWNLHFPSLGLRSQHLCFSWLCRERYSINFWGLNLCFQGNSKFQMTLWISRFSRYNLVLGDETIVVLLLSTNGCWHQFSANRNPLFGGFYSAQTAQLWYSSIMIQMAVNEEHGCGRTWLCGSPWVRLLSS